MQNNRNLVGKTMYPFSLLIHEYYRCHFVIHLFDFCNIQFTAITLFFIEEVYQMIHPFSLLIHEYYRCHFVIHLFDFCNL
jgi:hypothetical protein